MNTYTQLGDMEVTARCSGGHTWDAVHETRDGGKLRVVVPLNCPKCKRAAVATYPRGHVQGGPSLLPL